MATTVEPVEINIPSLPAKHDQFLQYVASHPKTSMQDLVEPYKQYDTELRKVFAQQPDHEAAKHPNVVPVFAGHEQEVKTRARDLASESTKERERYIMPLKAEARRPNGSMAIVPSMRDFRTNFNVFSESSLVDMDWSNVIIAGSAVVTCLLAVPEKHAGSKRALRQYYHEEVAPASDVDLFLYDLTEEQAIEKIKQIEQKVRDALLVETTTIRTKNTITIASRHPVRHVQIVLRIYKSISEILTGFDVDCSCAAYDGKQVYASPRALAAYMTQVNTVDLTRRSPSYENRLAKYAQRGFEVYWPMLDREKIDPTIFERAFARTEGLARLLILEKLPRSEDREAYLDQRRMERGRPAANRSRMRRRLIPGNIKNDHENEIAEWDVDEEASNYHSVSIPYGPKYHARKIEKLLFTKDLLLNSEWNKPKDREVNLHRHPAFFGSVDDVIHDCCGYCPKPATIEEEEVAEEESKTFVSGDVSFLKDDPGRQAIGSFNPLTADDWTTMAYVGNTALLCQAIVDGDLEYVQSWLGTEGNDPNTRDFTGRAPLHLAVSNSTIEVVQALIDADARLVARLVDGKTALHLAALRGRVDMVAALLRRSEANEEEEEKKVDARRAARKAAKENPSDVKMQDADTAEPPKLRAGDSDIEMIEPSDADDSEVVDQTTENSMVDIKHPPANADDQVLAKEDKDDEPDVYDVNVTAWDTAVSPLHLAIAKGHVDVVKFLVSDAGADVLLPIKLFNDHDRSARAAILTLVLALQLPTKEAEHMAHTLIELGASSAQASIDQTTVLQYCVASTPDMLDTLCDADMAGVMRAINHLSVIGYKWHPDVNSPFMTAIQAKDSATAIRLLELGANSEIDFAAYMKAYQTRFDAPKDSHQNKRNFNESHKAPVLTAVSGELPLLAKLLVEDYGVDPNTLHTDGHRVLENSYARNHTKGRTLLDVVEGKLKVLKDWKYDPKPPKAPSPLKADDEYMSRFEAGTYAFWSAKRQLDAAKSNYRRELKSYEKALESHKDRTGVAEKQEAINELASQFEELKDALVEKGAKSFYDLYPDIEKPDKPRDWGYHPGSRGDPKDFDVEIKFQIGDLTEQTQQRYEKLFEAAWRGNVKQVKELALVSWKDDNDEDKPPCKIAVQDQHGLSPFSIAVVQGHTELASTIMDIANAQHVKADASKELRYGIDPGDSDEEDKSSDDDEVPLYSEIVDDEFTIENVGEVSMQVKSRVLPTSMMMWSSNAMSDFITGPNNAKTTSSSNLPYRGMSSSMAGKRTNTGSIKLPNPPESSELRKRAIPEPDNVLRFAVYTNNPALLKSLLDLGVHYISAQPGNDDENDAKKIFAVSDRDFEYALEVGHAHLLSEIVRVTGAGIPLNSLAKKYGAELKEPPKYYQGLTVHGRKRKDWAQRGYDTLGYADPRSYNPPLLKAANFASQDMVEWLLSDSPLRCYAEFAEANKDDKRLKQLGLSKTGFKGTVEKFLNARSHTLIHCCIAGKYTAEADALLRYLLEAMPDLLEAKSARGMTPLQVTFELWREDWARLLIEAGADQTCRDSSGNNLLHSLLRRQNDITKQKHVEELKRMLDLIDKRVLPSLFIERATGSLTPLQSWLNAGGSGHEVEDQVLKLLLQYGGGKELSIISGSGDTPLHHTVKSGDRDLTQVILDHEATLLNRENATGRTPYEMAEDAALARLCSNPPPMPNDGFHFFDCRAKRLGEDPAVRSDLVHRSEQYFVEETPFGKPNGVERTWKLLQGTKAKLEGEGKWKRKLVTLNEANEVARRLAAMKASSRAREEAVVIGENESDAGDEEDQGHADEVATFMSQAKSAW